MEDIKKSYYSQIGIFFQLNVIFNQIVYFSEV